METRLLSDEENNDFFINFYSESINKWKLIKNKIDMKSKLILMTLIASIFIKIWHTLVKILLKIWFM